jgi:hypothetical protein
MDSLKKTKQLDQGLFFLFSYSCGNIKTALPLNKVAPPRRRGLAQGGRKMDSLKKTKQLDQGLFFLFSCTCGLIKTALPL